VRDGLILIFGGLFNVRRARIFISDMGEGQACP
jgi:hypothetical protein